MRHNFCMIRCTLFDYSSLVLTLECYCSDLNITDLEYTKPLFLSVSWSSNFHFSSQGQSCILATLVQQVPSIQAQRFVSSRWKLCRYACHVTVQSSFLEELKFRNASYTWNNRHYLLLHTFLYQKTSGHYVPQLAKLMIEINEKEKLFNLKGIAVSNKHTIYLSTMVLFQDIPNNA